MSVRSSESVSGSCRWRAGAAALAILAGAVSAPPLAAAQAAAQPIQPAVAAQPAQQQAQADVRTLLSNYGNFVPHARYGEVWKPTVTPEGWRPYEPCNWVFTKKYGWYYQDPTPWGQIVHHFGRWTNDPQMGWVWAPGDQFAPAWVVWRTSNDYVGWAPTPPDEDVRTVSTEAFNKSENWIFVSASKFGKSCGGAAPQPAGYAPQPYSAYAPMVAPAPQILTILGATTFVEQVSYVDGIAVFVLPPMFVGPFFDVDPWLDPWLGPWVPPLFGPWPAAFLNFFANELNWIFASFGFGPPVPMPLPQQAFPPGSPCNLPGVVCVPYSKKISPAQKHPLPALVLPPALLTKPPMQHAQGPTLPAVTPLPKATAPNVVPLGPLPPAPNNPGPGHGTGPQGAGPLTTPPLVLPIATPPHGHEPASTPPYRQPDPRPPRGARPATPNPAYAYPLRPLPPTLHGPMPAAHFHGIVQQNTPPRLVRQTFNAAPRASFAPTMRARPVAAQNFGPGGRMSWPVAR